MKLRSVGAMISIGEMDQKAYREFWYRLRRNRTTSNYPNQNFLLLNVGEHTFYRL